MWFTAQREKEEKRREKEREESEIKESRREDINIPVAAGILRIFLSFSV